jgi:hypothetical protein
MTFTQALSSYWAEKDGLRGCPACGSCNVKQVNPESGLWNYCSDCGLEGGVSVENWNTRSADPIITELHARLGLATEAIIMATMFIEIARNFDPRGIEGIKTYDVTVKKLEDALTTLSNDEWVPKEAVCPPGIAPIKYVTAGELKEEFGPFDDGDETIIADKPQTFWREMDDETVVAPHLEPSDKS